jgi:hypothetical protein
MIPWPCLINRKSIDKERAEHTPRGSELKYSYANSTHVLPFPGTLNIVFALKDAWPISSQVIIVPEMYIRKINQYSPHSML